MASPLCPRCGESAHWSRKADVRCAQIALSSALRERDEARADVGRNDAEWATKLAQARAERDREKQIRWDMEKERGETNAALKAEMQRADAAGAERDAAREALRPFGVTADAIPDYLKDGMRLYAFNDAGLTVGDFRRARAALPPSGGRTT